MAPQEQIDQLRPEVAAALEGRATLTTALKGMLEVGEGWRGRRSASLLGA
jgi:hypothetical protein